MSSLIKIGIIIPYFGTWPPWINYFLVSCKYNPTIDWHFFTDCGGQVKVNADNLIIHPMTLAEFNSLASEKLQMPVSITHPYKLCDFKPAYGKIFEDFLEEYNFWGYGDLDLVYGNLRKFFTDEILRQYDIISNHNEFVTGHFCILRNSEKVKHLFMSSGNFWEILMNEKYCGFDEQLVKFKVSPNPKLFRFSYKSNLIYHLLIYRLSKSFLRNSVSAFFWKILNKKNNPKQDDFTSIIKQTVKDNKIKADFKTTFLSDLALKKRKIQNWMIEWDGIKLVNKQSNEELLYFHFILSKTTPQFKIDNFRESVKIFSILETGINIIK